MRTKHHITVLVAIFIALALLQAQDVTCPGRKKNRESCWFSSCSGRDRSPTPERDVSPPRRARGHSIDRTPPSTPYERRGRTLEREPLPERRGRSLDRASSPPKRVETTSEHVSVTTATGGGGGGATSSHVDESHSRGERIKVNLLDHGVSYGIKKELVGCSSVSEVSGTCLSGRVTGSAHHENYASVEGSVSTGIAHGSANVKASVEAGVGTESGASVKFNDIDTELGAKIGTFVGGEAEASAEIGKHGVQAHIGGFVGASAEGKATIDVGGVGLGVGAEVSAGLGASGTIGFGYDERTKKINIRAECSACVGVGIGTKLEAVIDPNKVRERCC